jgi:hypothetical protein
MCQTNRDVHKNTDKVQMIMRWLCSQKHLWVFRWGKLMFAANIYIDKPTGNMTGKRQNVASYKISDSIQFYNLVFCRISYSSGTGHKSAH